MRIENKTSECEIVSNGLAFSEWHSAYSFCVCALHCFFTASAKVKLETEKRNHFGNAESAHRSYVKHKYIRFYRSFRARKRKRNWQKMKMGKYEMYIFLLLSQFVSLYLQEPRGYVDFRFRKRRKRQTEKNIAKVIADFFSVLFPFSYSFSNRNSQPFWMDSLWCVRWWSSRIFQQTKSWYVKKIFLFRCWRITWFR